MARFILGSVRRRVDEAVREIVVSRCVETLLDGGENGAESGDVGLVHCRKKSRANADGQITKDEEEVVDVR